ncbi:N-acyl homoserine lactonase family protein [Agromyces silvae]|uniref:N-acyl homoserine lactonase family protein n=1 Tax=Agromyces silvae TaxID=3388266 RepID=UPI00280B7AE9|nr:N-acyl homoserine lactonase family protein [Agromyces protaetiae]
MTTDVRHRITVVRYGTRTGHRHQMFLNDHLSSVPDAEIDMDYFFWVVDGPAGVFVVDTGFSRAGGAARGRELLADPKDLFAAAGADPASAPTVIVTHGHYDHVGNIDAFGSSTVVMAQAEFDFWTGPLAGRAHFAHSTDASDVAALRQAAASGRLRTFEGRLEVAPGLTLIEVGGHTPGQCIVLVETTEGAVLLTSDAAHYYEELEADRPFAVVADLPAMYEAFDLVNAMVADGTAAHVIAGHDPSVTHRYQRYATGEEVGVVLQIGEPATKEG